MIDLVNSINRNNSEFIRTGQRSTKTVEKQFAINDPDKKCPYSCLAKDGVIEYNGVTFLCDYKHNCITLGDVTSNPKKVLNIGLSGGGCLKVNVDNLDDLAKASGMFSPADLNAIMNADVDVKLDYEERPSDEEFEKRIEMLFEDMEKVV